MLLSISEQIKIFKNDYDKPVLKTNYTIEDIKGIWYSFITCSNGIIGYGNFSNFILYDTFSIKDIQDAKEDKISLFLSSHPYISQNNDLSLTIRFTDKFLKLYPNTEKLDKFLKQTYDIWLSEGLTYSYNHTNQEITFNVSNKRFTPNYVWAFLRTLHKLQIDKS